MSKFEYTDDETAPPRAKAKLELWDMLSMAVLLITFCIGAYFVLIFLSPNSKLNPLPPEPVEEFSLPTATITPIQLQPTWTLTPEIVFTETPTLLPTFTLEASATPFSLVPPTKTQTATATPKAPFSATVTYIASTTIHPELACNWQGIYGTVLDVNNADMLYLTIRLIGVYNGKNINQATVSGMFPANGRSGYEFFLGTVPISSTGQLFIQILDQSGLPLSDNIYINTYNDCSKNLALVRFKKNP